MNKETVTEAEFFAKNQEYVDKIYAFIKSLNIPTLKSDSVFESGFIARLTTLNQFEDARNLIVDGSICVYFSHVLTNDEYVEDIGEYDGKEKGVGIYIRLGATNTWVGAFLETPVGVVVDSIFNEKDEYSDDEEDYLNDYDYERLNRLSTIVAKTKGFNLLKNRDQRKSFSQEVLSNIDEDIDENEFYDIAATAETFYDFGVLPIEAKKLKNNGKSEAEIAKILGHTKAKIEKSLQIEIGDIYKKNIEQYEKEHEL